MIDNSLAIGDYLPVTSFIHRLDARTKIISFFILLYCTFSSNNSAIVCLNFGFIVFLAALSGATASIWGKCLRRFLPMLIITFLLNLFFTTPGFYYDLAGVMLPFGRDSLWHSVILTVQLFCAILLALILSFSTTPSSFTYAVEWFTYPLSWFKIPTGELSLTIFMALRFVPIFQQELQKIRNAQMSRGVNFETGSTLDKGRKLIGLLHPAFLATIRRSEILAQAMSAKGFTASHKRTHFSKESLAGIDLLACAAIALLVIFRYTLFQLIL